MATSRTLDELLVLIEASTAGLRQELNRGSADVKAVEQKVESEVSKADDQFSKLGKTIRDALGISGNAASMLRNTLGAFGVGLGVSGLVRFGQTSTDIAAQIGDAARVADFGIERFQRLRR